MSYLSLTSWSLHRSLGPLRMTEWDDVRKIHVTNEVPQPDRISLVELPVLAKQRGIRALDVCHFHFPSTSPSYLQQLRKSFSDHDVIFHTLLLDYGDISSPDPVRRAEDMRYIESWLDIASTVGARTLRVVAGESDPADADGLKRSSSAMRHLIDYGKTRNVAVVSENFRALSSNAENCLRLREMCEDRLPFVCDFGNFKSPSKYEELASLLPFAMEVHAKAHYDEQGMPDVAEYRRCLDVMKTARFDGPITLVYDAPGDEWEGIARIQSIVEDYL